MPAVGGAAAWRRSKGRQLLPGAAESEAGLRHPPTARAGGGVLRLLVQTALRAVPVQPSSPPMPVQKRASQG